MMLLAPLLLLPLLQASPQWGFGGFGGFSPYSRRGSYNSGYRGYGSPVAEPEPEPEPRLSRYRPGPSAALQSSSSPRLTRRLASSRQESSQFQQISNTNSRTFGNFGIKPSSRFGTSSPRIGSTRKPPVRLIPTRAPAATTRRPLRTTQTPRRTTQTPRRTTQAPRRTTQTPRRTTQTTRRTTRSSTQEPRRTTLRTTRRTTLSTTRSPPLPPQTTQRPPLPPTTTSPAQKSSNIEPLLPAPSEDFIDDVFEAFEGDSVSLRTNSRVVEGAWAVPPSLMAVAAVPGAPVIQSERRETRLPREPSQQQPPVVMDPYLEFMPVPAVPDPSRVSQEARRPKEGLNSLDINVSLQNTIQPRGPATKAPEAEEDSKKERRNFKRCQGRCVQQFCLPVDNLTVYEKCVDKCKSFCT